MHRLKTIGMLALVVLLLPLLLVCLLAVPIWWIVWGAVLRFWFWRVHASRGRPILFVYSESPNWQTYIESRILPRINGRAVVLNWSQRRLWTSACPWEARFFRHFAGTRDFNPLALVFCARGRIKAIRFHKAFLDFEHGKESRLCDAEADLFAVLQTS
jgi:hypothetical protein